MNVATLFWLGTVSAWARSPSAAAEAGITAQEAGNLDRAVAELDEALAKPDKLGGSLRARAHLSRGIARTGLAEERPDLALGAAQDLSAAAAADGSGELSAPLSDAKSAAFSELETLAAARAGDPAAARPFLEAAVTLRPEAIAVHYSLCSMVPELQADALAETHCVQVLHLIQTDSAVAPDPAFAQAALVLASSRSQQDAAAEALSEGLQVLDLLDKRRAPNRDMYTDAQWADTETTRDRVRASLEQAMAVRADGASSQPMSLDQLAAAVVERPDDYRLRIAYGDALDDAGSIDPSMAAYAAAVTIDPAASTAYVRLANAWVARAAAAQDAGDDTEVQHAMGEAKGLLQQARERAPDDAGIVEGLRQACRVTSDAACLKTLPD